MSQKHPERSVTLSTSLIIVIGAYIAAQIISNIASLKIGIVAGFAVDMGTFLYPVTFTLRDLVHKGAGKRHARTVILSSGAVTLLMALYFYMISFIKGDPSWGLDREFNAILNPVWRIALSSIIAQVISELADTEVYHFFVNRITTRYQWLRVLVSNAVSVPVDSLIFCVGAFAFALPAETVIDIFIFNVILKYAVTVFSVPMIYLVKDPSGKDRSRN